MNGNGRKPSSKQSNNERPWWHSGSHCLAALFWCFALAVAGKGTFSCEGWTLSLGLALTVSLLLAAVVSTANMAGGSR